MASGIAPGTLLLIIVAPAWLLLGMPGDLLEIALTQGRATLWWGATVAALYIVADMA